MEFTNSKGGETDGRTQGCKDPTVPRRLVGEGQEFVEICQKLGWPVNVEKSELWTPNKSSTL